MDGDDAIEAEAVRICAALVVRPERIPDGVATRIREVADACPEADVTLVGGLAAEGDP